MKYIVGEEEWLVNFRNNVEDRDAVYIHVTFDNGTKVFLRNIKEWLTISDYCKSKKLSIIEVGLRYRSNEIKVEAKDHEAVYIVTSMRGQFGADTKYCYTIGMINGDSMNKTLWATPELLPLDEYEVAIDTCFKEAIVYNDQKEETKAI